MNATLLAVNELKIYFGKNKQQPAAVDKINFSIAREETLVLLGESGSGKSITALSIMRLLPVAARLGSGTILFENEDLLSLPEYRMRKIRGGRIAMIFQEPENALNPVLTVGQQIGETLYCHQRMSKKERRQRGIALLAAVEIPDPARRIDDYPHQFSGGMKQRIMIAIALAGEPDLLIADEPTTALDVTTQAQVLTLLQKIQGETGMAILFITHDLGVAAQMADRAAVMQKGKIVEMQDRARLFSKPTHPYTKQLFAALPRRKEKSEQNTAATTKSGSKTLLSVQDLKIHFPICTGLFKRVTGHVKAVDGISFEVDAGQTLAIVGESGSGKTSTGKGLVRLLPSTAGTIQFAGRQMQQLSSAELRRMRADIQIIFQDPYTSMNPRMMINEIIQEGMILQKIEKTKQQREHYVDELLQQVGLAAEHKYRYPHEFSGGQRQRICIARALAVRPSLLICDEPTSALDVSVQAQILALLKDLQKKQGLAYLFITHDIGVVESIADRIAVMYKGKIVEQGTADHILSSATHPYTRKLLAAVPRIDIAS